MPKQITDTAQIKCDKGNKPVALKVTSQHFDHIDGKAQATENDNVANTNIASFGLCSVSQKKCTPAPTQWQNTSIFTIEGFKELTDESFCPCSIGGKINFINAGQSGFITID